MIKESNINFNYHYKNSEGMIDFNKEFFQITFSVSFVENLAHERQT